MSITLMEKNLRFDFASKFLKEPFEFWNGAIFISEIQSRLNKDGVVSFGPERVENESLCLRLAGAMKGWGECPLCHDIVFPSDDGLDLRTTHELLVRHMALTSAECYITNRHLRGQPVKRPIPIFISSKDLTFTRTAAAYLEAEPGYQLHMWPPGEEDIDPMYKLWKYMGDRLTHKYMWCINTYEPSSGNQFREDWEKMWGYPGFDFELDGKCFISEIPAVLQKIVDLEGGLIE